MTLYNRVFSFINNNLFALTGKISKKTRMLIVFVCCLLLEGTAFLYIGFRGDGRDTMIYGTCLTIVIAVFSIDRNAGWINWNKRIIYPLMVFGFGIILVSFLHPIGEGYLIYAIDLVIVFPFLYYVWSNRGDYDSLFRCIAMAGVSEGLLSFFYCVLTATQGELGMHGYRMVGHTSNANLLGVLGLVMIISGLYLLMRNARRLSFAVINSAAIGAGISYVLLSVSRTAMICSGASALVFVVFIFKRIRAGKAKISITALLVIALVVTGFYMAGTRIDDLNRAAIQRNSITSDQTEETQPEVTQEQIEERNHEKAKVKRRVKNKGDINEYSSGRIAIWKVYIKNFSLFGKPMEDIEDEFGDQTEIRAHNNIIDYYYRFGYIFGTAYLWFYLLTGLYGVIILIGRSAKPEQFFSVVIIGVYSFYALVEIAVLPFTRLVPCMFFLTLAPVVTNLNQNRENATDYEEQV